MLLRDCPLEQQLAEPLVQIRRPAGNVPRRLIRNQPGQPGDDRNHEAPPHQGTEGDNEEGRASRDRLVPASRASPSSYPLV